MGSCFSLGFAFSDMVTVLPRIMTGTTRNGEKQDKNSIVVALRLLGGDDLICDSLAFNLHSA